MPVTSPRRFSVSTWSLHRTIGVTYPDSPGQARQGRTETWGAGTVDLLDIPTTVAAAGIHTLEICHFQIPSREESYLNELRQALSDAKVELFSVLVDAGDITDAVHSDRDLKWVGEWVDTAAQLGAKRARVIAGKALPTAENLALSKRNMRELADRAKSQGVRLTTENWFDLLSRPEHVHELLDSLDGDVGLNLDFGNWGGETKYADLAAIAPYAESCHAKCAFIAPGEPDSADYRHCLDLSREQNFSGPFTLIYDGADDNEWAALAIEREIVRPYIV
ncbi:xylose isomerase [Armatimonadota bacterium]|nr:xylose isomerase [Armatimonadota bacterium]